MFQNASRAVSATSSQMVGAFFFGTGPGASRSAAHFHCAFLAARQCALLCATHAEQGHATA